MSSSELRVMNLPDPVGNGSGDPLAVSEFRDMVVQVTATALSATVTLEKSLDGSNWEDVSAGLTAPGFISVPQEAIQSLRITISGFTSQTALAVTWAGRNARSLG